MCIEANSARQVNKYLEKMDFILKRNRFGFTWSEEFSDGRWLKSIKYFPLSAGWMEFETGMLSNKIETLVIKFANKKKVRL